MIAAFGGKWTEELLPWTLTIASTVASQDMASIADIPLLNQHSWEYYDNLTWGFTHLN